MRDTKNLKLPISKKECEVVTYFTRGDINQINKITFENVKLKGGHGNQEFEMDFTNSLKAKSKALELAVIKLDGKDCTIDEIENLPEKDVEVIEKHINEITPTEKDKKK